MGFETKIALVVRDDLKTWQKLNVTSFLTSGIIGTTTGLLGEAYRDASEYHYTPLAIQPIIILVASAGQLNRTRKRAVDRDIRLSIYIEDMFATDNDVSNRQTVSKYTSDKLPLVGLGMRGDKRIIDKISKGLKLHN